MIKFITFVALIIVIAITLYAVGKLVHKLLTMSQASNLEEDIKKGEKAKQTIKQLNKKIK